MPVAFINPNDGASDQPEALCRSGTPPVYCVRLWPHRSLPPQGFVWFIGITCVMLCFPLLALLGTAALWGLLPFLALAVAGMWIALNHSYKTGQLIEELSIWPDQMHLIRIEPSGARHEWQANPYWVDLRLHDAPVEHYLTLKGGDREVELGAFLSPDERVQLRDDLETRLKALADARL